MFERLIRYSVHHKLPIGLLVLALVAWGVWSLMHLPFDATPDITSNQVQVIAQAPSLGAQEVEQNITTPIETALANIPNVTERRSISRSGLAVITLVFTDNTDIYWARQQISQQLAEAAAALPEGKVETSLGPVATGLGEIYQYTIRARKGYEKKYSLTDLRALQDWVVRRQLAGTPGVAEVSGWGGYVKQYEVAVDADRLVAAGVTIPEVYDALATGNENTGGSYIEKQSAQYYIRGLGLVETLDDIRRIPVKTVGGLPILVGDVADVRLCHAMRYGAVTEGGEGEVVAGITLMLKGENFQEVIARVKERIAQIQRTLPEGVVIEPYIDRTQLVDRVTHTIARNLIEGGLIVVFILVLFLGSWRAGLVVASVIPLAMLFAFGMMRLTGVSGNLMSLGAIDFGLIVDGAVIIVEAVVSNLSPSPQSTSLSSLPSPLSPQNTSLAPRPSPLSSKDSIVEHAACRIRHSAAFGEIIIMTVYLPLMTLVGIEGKMFRPMAMTIFFAILGAFILSLTYVPMASALLLKARRTTTPTLSDRLMAAVTRVYKPILAFALRHARAVVAVMAVVLAVTVWQFTRLGGEFIPSLEEGDFAAELSMAQGTSLSQMVETTSLAERILRERFPEVRRVVTRIGSAEIPTDPMPVERADALIALRPKDEWTSARTKDELMEKMEQALADIPGLEAELTQPIQMRNNELITGIRQDVAVKIFGPSTDELTRQAARVAALIRDIPGVGDPYIEEVEGLPQLQVSYDRERLARYGISVQTANSVLATAFAGSTAGTVYEGDRRYDLVLRMDDRLRSNPDALADLALPLPGGGTVPLAQVAAIGYVEAPAQVTHENGERRIYVGFNVRGRDVQSTVRDIQARLDSRLSLPAGYHYEYGGEFQNLQQATRRLLVAVPVALLIIVALLLATLRSVRQTLLVCTAIPLSAIGGVWALTLRGLPFSISAGVGFIALFGVAVLNGIVLMGEINQIHKPQTPTPGNQTPTPGPSRGEGGAAASKITAACLHRLRPVIMTALVASLGFLPMALSTGDGAEVQRPLATVVIGGLVTSTILTLLVLPALMGMKAILRIKRITT